MKFLVQWPLPHSTFRPAVARFLKAGGMPPAGVTLVGRWKAVLDTARTILSIDANPLTPKFWGQLLAAVGVPLEAADKRKEELSNKRQAFQFMKSVEDSCVDRIVSR